MASALDVKKLVLIHIRVDSPRFGRTVSRAQTARAAPHREIVVQVPQLDTDPISRILFPVSLRALLSSSLQKTKAWVSIYGAAADAPYQAILSLLLFSFTSFA